MNSISFLVKLFLLFLLLIETFRTIFIVYYWDKLQVASSPLTETLLSYVNAMSLDIATASILVVIPWLLLSINTLFYSCLIKVLLFIYTFSIIIFSTFIYIAELGIYNEWEEKPTFKIFTYLKHPDEAIASNPLVYTLMLSAILIISLWAFYKLTRRVYSTYNLNVKINYKVTAFFILVLPIVIFLGARGGTKEIPISQSSVYFSKHKVYNDVAISTVYNFLHSITENQSIIDGKNSYKIELDEKIKKIILDELMATPQACESEKILTISRPNIVLVIWESLAGDFIKNEKYQEVIPNIMSMSKEGILFTKAYSSATLSHEGLPSIFSGWPALAGTYITNLPSKFYKLPFITQSLKSEGYASMFLFGGQLRYGNLTSYMYGNGFDIIEENSDIQMSNDKEGVLGFHDGYMLEYLKQKTSKLKEPFLSSIFTVSSHSPYDQPMEDVIEWGVSDKGYLNSIYYTDKSIGEFIKSVKKESWYKNTLFIFVADHAHHTPMAWSRADKHWHHIPMLFYGDVIKEKYRGVSIDKIVSQRDIPATLLSQLDIDHSKFEWSRDILCKGYKENAYIMNKNGFGLITNKGSLTYDLKESRVIYEDMNSSGLRLKGNVYMEKLLQTYLDY
ncbi:LTA synthase family protein [Sulfurimonas sp.]|jgi:phosphoglycerol transferase MdoB-like AlkP superfamily enzyme|uniref:LTA synthase family protein n=1 Tax=Sulfurimonas sp. TaxID=2022749 RepID=UPI0025DCB53A|nr:alkaline phosphatase family protein [Sulfurimonas sp.]MBT5934194.1 sulfatase-like hydrolase/transferase [Sulfurimonas sp.]